MHDTILTSKQQDLLKCLQQFSKSYYLGGDTAIALQLGHRKSTDFDLFTREPINGRSLKETIFDYDPKSALLLEDTNQVHLIANGVKLAFFSYPHDIEHRVTLNNVLCMPTLLSLSAMKAFSLGRRAQWKDYVDFYFLLRDRFSLVAICAEAYRLFGKSFSERLFRAHLAYHKDIDYSEAVEYMPGHGVDPESIRSFLVEKTLAGVTR